MACGVFLRELCARCGQIRSCVEHRLFFPRFGLDGGSEKTLEEVGERFGVTRERVRQIQNIALAKLRKMIEKLDAVQK